MAMAVSPRMAPLARWAAVAAVALMGLALLLTAWTTYRSVQDASATLVRGQANAFQQAVRSRVFQLDEAPSDADLQAILEAESAEGLRYLAWVERSGRVLAQAGTAGDTPHVFPDGALAEEPVLAGSRVRTAVRAGPRPPSRLEGWRRRAFRPAWVVVEFEPVQALALRASARRTFGIGALAATGFWATALALVRWVLRREARERKLEQERRLASLGEMSAVLAHEIRNPLASLKGNAQLLWELLPEGERSRTKAERVVEEAIRLETLTNQLLEYVRTGDIERHDVAPGALLREAAASVDVSIEVDDRRAPERWPLDRGRMREVLVNLLENAVQAGGPVRAEVFSSGAALVVDIRDHGPGVPEGDRERIFEPFFTRRTRGTGLGLAVVKRVVELHGGTVTVDNATGGGAVFRITLSS